MYSLPHQVKQVKYINKSHKDSKLAEVIFNNYLLRNISSNDLRNKLLFKPLKSLKSLGSFLIFQFGKEHYLIVNTSLHSKFSIGEAKKDKLVFSMDFEDNDSISITESKGYSDIYYEYYDLKNFRLLDENIDIFDLDQRKFKQVIKNFDPSKKVIYLLFESNISGLDLRLVSEVLFDAKITPMKKISEMNPHETDLLYNSLLKILNKDLKLIDNKDPFANHKLRNFIFDRDGANCFDCGKKIKLVSFKGYKIYYCSYCQN